MYVCIHIIYYFYILYMCPPRPQHVPCQEGKINFSSHCHGSQYDHGMSPVGARLVFNCACHKFGHRNLTQTYWILLDPSGFFELLGWFLDVSGTTMSPWMVLNELAKQFLIMSWKKFKARSNGEKPTELLGAEIHRRSHRGISALCPFLASGTSLWFRSELVPPCSLHHH